MLNKRIGFLRWTVLPALLALSILAAPGLTSASLAAGDGSDSIAATGAPMADEAAAGAQSASGPVLGPQHCSFTAPCVVERTSYGWVLDTGGPGLLNDYFGDD